MAKHPIAQRSSHRRRQDEPEDAFIAEVLKVSTWARQHVRLLVTLGAVLVLLAAGGIYWASYQRTLEEQATLRLTELRETVASGDNQQAIRELEAFLSRFGRTDAAEQARMILVNLYLFQDQPQRVIEMLHGRDAINEAGDPAAGMLLAMAYEEMDQHEQAISAYLDIAEAARFGYQRREALEAAARLRMQQGQYREAIQLFDRVLDDLDAQAPERGYYEMWRAEASAKAAATG